MTDADLATLMRDTMFVALQLGGPPLAAMLIVGVLVSLVQAVTQVNETTLAFVPKVVALAATLVLIAPFMMATLVAFAHLLFDRIVAIGAT